jgi:heptosyltransferase-3
MDEISAEIKSAISFSDTRSAAKGRVMRPPRRILIIQLRRIGDVLLTTPVIRALRKHFPKSYIAFLAERESSDLLALNPYLDQAIVLDRDRYKNFLYWPEKIWQIRRMRFDLVIDFLGNPRSAYISFLSGAKHRVGYDLGLRRSFYNLVVKGDGKAKYAAVHRLDSLRLLGKQSSDPKLDFIVSEQARLLAEEFFSQSGIDQNSLIVSVSPTSRRHFNRWPLERYARLADWLISRFNSTVVLVWGPGEKEVVEKVKGLMKENPVISWETENLLQLGAVLERCDLHLGNDNGTKHVAVAMGRPTITVYGPHDPTSWTYPGPSRHKFVKKRTDCPDCDKIKHKCRELSCLDKITVEDVQGAFLQLLRDLKGGEERGLVEKIERLTVDQR